MVQTGILILLSWMATLLPLLLLFVILLRRLYVHASWRVICLFCLLYFCENILVHTGPYPPSLNGLVQLGEFVLLLFYFGLQTRQKHARDLVHMALVSFTSVAATLYAVKDTHAIVHYLPVIEGGLLMVAAMMALAQQVRDQQLLLFKTPVFWIAGGVMVYAGMMVLMELVTSWSAAISTTSLQEKSMVLYLAQLVRFVLFMIAAYVSR